MSIATSNTEGGCFWFLMLHLRMRAGQAFTVVLCAVDRVYLGACTLNDELRPEAADTIRRLRDMGLEVAAGKRGIEMEKLNRWTSHPDHSRSSGDALSNLQTSVGRGWLTVRNAHG